MEKQDSFIEKCLSGEADIDELDDYVEYYHTHTLDVSLMDYLGLTPEEYEAWGHTGDSVFKLILSCRKNKTSFKECYRTIRRKSKQLLEILKRTMR